MLASVLTIVLASRSGPLELCRLAVLSVRRYVDRLRALNSRPSRCCRSGRPSLRGGFMMLNGVVTQLSMGAGALFAGWLIALRRKRPHQRLSLSVGEISIVVSLSAIGIAW